MTGRLINRKCVCAVPDLVEGDVWECDDCNALWVRKPDGNREKLGAWKSAVMRSLIELRDTLR